MNNTSQTYFPAADVTDKKYYYIMTMADTSREMLKHHASECIQCGACEKRCPFSVPVRTKMKQAAGLFGI